MNFLPPTGLPELPTGMQSSLRGLTLIWNDRASSSHPSPDRLNDRQWTASAGQLDEYVRTTYPAKRAILDIAWTRNLSP